MKVIALAALVAVVLAKPAFSHHSFAAEYDSTKSLKLTGTVTKVGWQNPHTYIYVDVTDKKSGDRARLYVQSPLRGFSLESG